MPKPSEFFIGVLDFFAILLPGAIATALLAPKFGPVLLGSIVAAPSSPAGNWAVFLTCSYFLGHLVFLAGSYIDLPYDRLRNWRNPYGNESAYQRATSIRNSLIEEIEREALNTFQWSRSVLLSRFPAGAEDVRRLEADSKFFRSLLVVCLLSSVVFFSAQRPLAGLAALAVMVPCFARYYERRLKSTTQAYIHILTLHRLGGLDATKGTDGA